MGTTAQTTESATAEPSPTTESTAVAETAATEKVSQTELAIGTLPEHIKQGLILKRQQNLVTATIAGTNWGKGLDLNTRRAISDWARTVDIDPGTELDVLGGTFYKNAKFYIRRQAELMAQGVIEYAYMEHVEVDSRLDIMAKRTDNPELAKWASEEKDRRMQQRSIFNIPEKAESSVVWHVKVRGIAVEFAAAKWCGGGTRKKDPVGDDFPVETSETRAARRTMRLLADWDPNLKRLVDPNDEDSIDLQIGDRLRKGLKQAHEDARMALEQARGHSILQLNTGDPYSLEATRPRSEVLEAATSTEHGERYTPSIAEPATAARTLEPIDDLDLLSPEELAEHKRKAK